MNVTTEKTTTGLSEMSELDYLRGQIIILQAQNEYLQDALISLCREACSTGRK